MPDLSSTMKRFIFYMHLYIILYALDEHLPIFSWSLMHFLIFSLWPLQGPCLSASHGPCHSRADSPKVRFHGQSTQGHTDTAVFLFLMFWFRLCSHLQCRCFSISCFLKCLARDEKDKKRLNKKKGRRKKQNVHFGDGASFRWGDRWLQISEDDFLPVQVLEGIDRPRHVEFRAFLLQEKTPDKGSIEDSEKHRNHSNKFDS